MMKKIGIIKRVLCISLVFLLNINALAAVVSDNDGSAFITKAEFDSLKNNFQSQIDQYNQSIDSKIDGAIATYLSGIKISAETNMEAICKKYGYIKSFDDANDLPWVEPTWGITWMFQQMAGTGISTWTPEFGGLTYGAASTLDPFPGAGEQAITVGSIEIPLNSGAAFGRYWSYLRWDIQRPATDADYGKVRLVTRTSNATSTGATAQWLGYYDRTCNINGYAVNQTTGDFTNSAFWTIVLNTLDPVRNPTSAGTVVLRISDIDCMNNGASAVLRSTGTSDAEPTLSQVHDNFWYWGNMYHKTNNFVKISDITPLSNYLSDNVICAFNGNSAISKLTTNEGRYFNNDTSRSGHTFCTSITRDWWGQNVTSSYKISHMNSEFKNVSDKESKWYGNTPKIYGGLNYFPSDLLASTSTKKITTDLKKLEDLPTSIDISTKAKPYEGFVENVAKQADLYTLEFDEMAATAPTTAIKYDNYVASVWDTNKTKTTNPHLSIAAGIPVVKVKKNNTYKIKVEAKSTTPAIYFWLAKNAFAATGNPDNDTNAVNLQIENSSLTAAGNKGVRLNMPQATSASGCIITYTATEDGYLYAKWGKSTTAPGGSIKIEEVIEINNNV